MSHSCQKATFALQQIFLFDHLVSAGEHGRGNVDAERLGRLEIDHQLVLGRRLHRKISRFLALEDAVDVSGRAPMQVDSVGPVGDETSVWSAPLIVDSFRRLF
jgi:hypothetical protein